VLTHLDLESYAKWQMLSRPGAICKPVKGRHALPLIALSMGGGAFFQEEPAEKVMVADTATHGSQSCKDYLEPAVERGANVRTLLKVDAAPKGAACARRRKQQWLIHTSNLEWNMTASSFRFKNEQRERMTKLLSISSKDAITAVDRMEHPLQIILEAVGNVTRTGSVMQATP
jgi:hypothetical protein